MGTRQISNTLASLDTASHGDTSRLTRPWLLYLASLIVSTKTAATVLSLDDTKTQTAAYQHQLLLVHAHDLSWRDTGDRSLSLSRVILCIRTHFTAEQTRLSVLERSILDDLIGPSEIASLPSRVSTRHDRLQSSPLQRISTGSQCSLDPRLVTARQRRYSPD